MIYGTRANGKLHGSVFTRIEVVETMLELVQYSSHKNLSNITVVDPSAGEGVFLIAVLERLYRSAKKFDFAFYPYVLSNILAYEIDPNKCQILLDNVCDFFIEKGENFKREDLAKIVLCEDFLKSRVKADLIVGNPPYVRHEKIPEREKEYYKQYFRTFNFRSDLYICFYEKGLTSLKNGGQLCLICSNRWLKNQYGKGLRKLVADCYLFPLILNLENMSAFEEEVTAYPAITLMKNEKPESFSSTRLIDFSSLSFNDFKGNSLNEYHEFTEIFVSENGVLDTNGIQCQESDLYKIEEQGFKIGIGVATGADAIFISRNFLDTIEREVLIPIISSKDLKNGKVNWVGNFLINPFLNNTSTLINLDKYPRLKKYFHENKDRLSARHTARKTQEKWYKTIDRVYPKLTKEPKLLLPDFGTKQQVFLDTGNFYPHHNLYYITGKSIEELQILGAILMSELVTMQLHLVGNKMNGGYIRWQSQNLRKLNIPHVNSFSSIEKKKLESAFNVGDVELINEIVNNRNKKAKRLPISNGLLFHI